MAKKKIQKKAAGKKKSAPVKKAVRRSGSAVKKTARIKAAREARKAVGSIEELKVEQAKFSLPQQPPAVLPSVRARELPRQYDCDRIVLQVRDPWWIHAYWEVRNATIERLKRELREDFYKAKMILRVYDVSRIIFNGRNAHRFFDICLPPGADNWYIDTAAPGRSWCVDLGLLLADGRFIAIARSNVVHTPIDGPSWITDEEWMIPEESFKRLYGLGFGVSSPVGKDWRMRMISSPGVTSPSSPVKKAR